MLLQRGPRTFTSDWVPACAGMTTEPIAGQRRRCCFIQTRSEPIRAAWHGRPAGAWRGGRRPRGLKAGFIRLYPAVATAVSRIRGTREQDPRNMQTNDEVARGPESTTAQGG